MTGTGWWRPCWTGGFYRNVLSDCLYAIDVTDAIAGGLFRLPIVCLKAADPLSAGIVITAAFADWMPAAKYHRNLPHVK